VRGAHGSVQLGRSKTAVRRLPVEMRLTYELWGRPCPVARWCRHRVREMRPPCPAAPGGGPGGRKSEFRPFFRPLERSRNGLRTPPRLCCRLSHHPLAWPKPDRRTSIPDTSATSDPSACSQSESRAGHGRARRRVRLVYGPFSRCPSLHIPADRCRHRAGDGATTVPRACHASSLAVRRSQSVLRCLSETSRDAARGQVIICA
jgi:hypothetical protein